MPRDEEALRMGQASGEYRRGWEEAVDAAAKAAWGIDATLNSVGTYPGGTTRSWTQPNPTAEKCTNAIRALRSMVPAPSQAQVPSMAGIPANVRLTFAKFEPGDPQSDTGASVQLAINDPDPKRVVVVLGVSKPGWGFGEFTIIQTPEGVFIDSEMSKPETVKEALIALVDKAVFDHETDPAKHALYNQATGSRCGERCLMCFPVEAQGTASAKGGGP